GSARRGRVPAGRGPPHAGARPARRHGHQHAVNPRGRVVAAGTLARVPSEGLALAVVFDVTARGGSVAFAGVLLALTTLPQIVTGPLGGAALDATTRPGRVLAAACVASAAAIAGLAWADSAGAVAIIAALALAGTDPILTGGLSATF